MSKNFRLKFRLWPESSDEADWRSTWYSSENSEILYFWSEICKENIFNFVKVGKKSKKLSKRQRKEESKVRGNESKRVCKGNEDPSKKEILNDFNNEQEVIDHCKN